MKIKKGILLILCTLLLMAAGCSRQEEKKNVYCDAAPAGMEFLACGESGTLTRIDMDGEVHTIETGIREDLNGVVKHDDTLLAVGEKGRVFIQEAGNSIEVPEAADGNDLYDAENFKGLWLAAADGGIWASKDAREWEQVQSGEGRFLSIACSDELSVCAREDGVLYLSEDGETWEEISFNEYYGTDMKMQQIIYGGGLFYLLGEEENAQRIFTSSMGSVWSERVLDMLEGEPADLSDETFVGMVWDGQEVIVGCESGSLLTLPDCAECNKMEKSGMDNLTDVAYCGGYYLFLDQSGNGKVVAQDDAGTRQYKISVESAHEKTEAVFVDVRSEEEYAETHIEGSINLPVDEIGKLSQYIPDKSQEIIFCCASGIRSKTALDKALEMGYQNVFYMGNVEQW